MDGLSAKVFRTYNASYTLQQELNKKLFNDNDDIENKVNYYEESNKQVAILCNHQKTVSKNFNQQSETLQNFVIKKFKFP
jgi:DNA topoisomerase-1